MNICAGHQEYGARALAYGGATDEHILERLRP